MAEDNAQHNLKKPALTGVQKPRQHCFVVPHDPDL